ncbi:MAG: MATE family efflux transporter, partial [Gammaproteobacteria bacterium]
SWGYRFSLTYGAIVALILFISADFISGLFTDEPGAIRTAGMHMKLVPWSYGMLGISAASVSAFNAIAKPLPGMVVSMTRTIAVYAPLAFLLAAMLGLQGVFIAAFAANVIAGSVGFIWFRTVFNPYLQDDPALQQA